MSSGINRTPIQSEGSAFKPFQARPTSKPSEKVTLGSRSRSNSDASVESIVLQNVEFLRAFTPTPGEAYRLIRAITPCSDQALRLLKSPRTTPRQVLAFLRQTPISPNFELFADSSPQQALLIAYDSLQSPPSSPDNTVVLALDTPEILSEVFSFLSVEQASRICSVSKKFFNAYKERCKQSQAKRAAFSHMKLKKIPGPLVRMLRMVVVNLSFNMLSSLPQSFSNLSNLKSLNLSNNKFREMPKVLTLMLSSQRKWKELQVNLTYNKIAIARNDQRVAFDPFVELTG